LQNYFDDFIKLWKRVKGRNGRMAFFFLGLGSTAFGVLWWRSRFVPRALAMLGVLGSVLIGASALLFIVLTAGTAMGFPWGAEAQAGFVGVCTLLLAWNDYAINGVLFPALAGPATGSMFTAGLVSVFSVSSRSSRLFRWPALRRKPSQRYGRSRRMQR
jgi:hypothetical protein